jgi:hypothetical protein
MFFILIQTGLARLRLEPLTTRQMGPRAIVVTAVKAMLAVSLVAGVRK